MVCWLVLRRGHWEFRESCTGKRVCPCQHVLLIPNPNGVLLSHFFSFEVRVFDYAEQVAEGVPDGGDLDSSSDIFHVFVDSWPLRATSF